MDVERQPSTKPSVKSEAGSALISTGVKLMAKKHYRTSIICFEAIIQNRNDFLPEDYAKASIWSNAARSLGFHYAGDAEQFYKYAERALALCVQNQRSGLLLHILIKFLHCLPRTDYHRASKMVKNLETKYLAVAGSALTKTLLRALQAHILLLAPDAVGEMHSAVAKAMEAGKGMGNLCPGFVKVYIHTLNLCARARTGKPQDLEESIQELQKSIIGFRGGGDAKVTDKEDGMKLILDDDTCISWRLLEGRLIESLTALCEGVVLRTQARLQDSLTAFSKALSLANVNADNLKQSGLKTALAGDELRWELQTHTAMSYLMCCEFTACANLLHLMLRKFQSSPSSGNTKRRRAVLLFLCGRYAEATGHSQQSRALLKNAWRETEKECATGEKAIDPSLLRLIRLRHAWKSSAAKGSQMAASALEEATLIQAAAASTGNVTVEVYAMLVQGLCLQKLNRSLEARIIFRNSLKISNELQHKVAVASSLSILGRSLLVDRRLKPPRGSKQEISEPTDQKAWGQAREAFQSALLLAARMKDGVFQLSILQLLSDCLGREGDLNKREKIVQYMEKRDAELKKTLEQARNSEYHSTIISWKGNSKA
mmetsp:Transcript_13336/g.26101  ORF Transcript_13336/g.26101 Transcript_13336/m.26101 type:complete len:600 (+) Transcript_13336:45-1844(+)